MDVNSEAAANWMRAMRAESRVEWLETRLVAEAGRAGRELLFCGTSSEQRQRSQSALRKSVSRAL
jgi:hypothetical protein